MSITFGAYAAPTNLADYKAIYETELARIKADQADKKDTDAAYLDALQRVKTEATQKADVRTVKAAVAETERFLEFGNLTDEMPAIVPDTIGVVQDRYRQALTQIHARRDARILLLSQKYLRGLKSLTAKLLAADELGEANEAAAEMKRIEFVIADLGSRIPDTKVEVEPEAPEPARLPTVPSALKRGLVLHFGFDKDEGSIARSKGTHRKSGKVVNAKWREDGRIGGAYQFNGRNSYVDYGNSSYLNVKKGTLAAWIRTTNAGTFDRCIAAKSGEYSLYLRDNEFGFFDWGANVWRGCGARPDSDGEWHHVAVVFEDAAPYKTTLYFDGEAKTQTSMRFRDLKKGFMIGHGDWPQQYFTGLIDEVMLWNRMLSEEEIKQIYKLPQGR